VHVDVEEWNLDRQPWNLQRSSCHSSTLPYIITATICKELGSKVRTRDVALELSTWLCRRISCSHLLMFDCPPITTNPECSGSMIAVQLLLLALARCTVDLVSGAGGEFITQDMVTRCPLKSTALVACTNRNQISIDFLSGNSCVDCLTEASVAGDGKCEGANDQVCAAVASCSSNCTAIAGECAEPFDALLQCQLEKGVPINNCTISCEATSAATERVPQRVVVWGASITGVILSSLLVGFV
jgi:hypothetical protein